jgi:2-amino-4-ketopentanoate thiolase beta subunit
MTAYADVLSRRAEIVRRAVGIDYDHFETGHLAFDYEGLMAGTGYDLDAVRAVQRQCGVGGTPFVELRRLTEVVRRISPPGRGARLFVKDEAANPSGSFKDRRASVSVYEAKRRDYPGVAAATSGNYGAAVASQAAKLGLPCIVVQEAFDSRGVSQPEICEKTRACEAYGAEVLRLTVGPELFTVFLSVLDETGFFDASLYTPYSVAGIETLGHEVAVECFERTGRFPDVVVVTHAGGGNVTGTARGLRAAGALTSVVVGASVDLAGLHMASDRDFNRKSFTTGHTGVSVPFTTWPDRADVPRNAARPLRYLDRFVTVTQGEVFYVTQALAELEGLERGPAGNTSLAAAMAIARELDREQVVVVQETEYTGAGKHPLAQLRHARLEGIRVVRGDPSLDQPGGVIAIPEHPSQLRVVDVDLDQARRSYVRHALGTLPEGTVPCHADVTFLADDTRWSEADVQEVIHALGAPAR